jgi:hypothetical protein
MLPAAEAGCVRTLPALRLNEYATHGVEAVRDSVVIEKPSQAVTGIWMDCVFVVKCVVILAENLGKIGMGSGPRSPEILIAMEEFGEGFFDGPMTDSESIKDYRIIVGIDGTNALSDCGASDWIVGESSSEAESDSFGKEATVVGEGEATISVSGKLTEGGADPGIWQAAAEEAARKFRTEAVVVLTIGVIEVDGARTEADREARPVFKSRMDFGIETEDGNTGTVCEYVLRRMVGDNIVSDVGAAVIAS